MTLHRRSDDERRLAAVVALVLLAALAVTLVAVHVLDDRREARAIDCRADPTCLADAGRCA